MSNIYEFTQKLLNVFDVNKARFPSYGTLLLRSLLISAAAFSIRKFEPADVYVMNLTRQLLIYMLYRVKSAVILQMLFESAWIISSNFPEKRIGSFVMFLLTFIWEHVYYAVDLVHPYRIVILTFVLFIIKTISSNAAAVYAVYYMILVVITYWSSIPRSPVDLILMFVISLIGSHFAIQPRSYFTVLIAVYLLVTWMSIKSFKV